MQNNLFNSAIVSAILGMTLLFVCKAQQFRISTPEKPRDDAVNTEDRKPLFEGRLTAITSENNATVILHSAELMAEVVLVLSGVLGSVGVVLSFAEAVSDFCSAFFAGLCLLVGLITEPFGKTPARECGNDKVRAEQSEVQCD